jgi:hypothetical protein
MMVESQDKRVYQDGKIDKSREHFGSDNVKA